VFFRNFAFPSAVQFFVLNVGFLQDAGEHLTGVNQNKKYYATS